MSKTTSTTQTKVIQEYFSNTKKENIHFLQKQIMNAMIDQIEWVKSNKEKDVDLNVADAKALNEGCVSDQDSDGTTIRKVDGSSSAIGSPHYDEQKLISLQYKVENLELEIEMIDNYSKYLQTSFEELTKEQYVPKPKRVNYSQNRGTNYWKKRFAS